MFVTSGRGLRGLVEEACSLGSMHATVSSLKVAGQESLGCHRECSLKLHEASGCEMNMSKMGTWVPESSYTARGSR